MLGTIVNTCTIVAGTLLGAFLHRGIREQYKTALYDALGLASLAIGLNATIQNLPKSQYPVLFIVALAIGTVVGTRLDIDGRFRRLIDRKSKSPNAQAPAPPNAQAPAPDPARVARFPLAKTLPPKKNDQRGSLADGLSTAILLYCIGPLSMLGPVISALQGDNTFLFTNATLDFVSATIFASTYGIGMILAAPVLFLWQGMFYAVARFSSQAVSDALMAELLIVGGLMIMGSGLNLLRLKELKTLNLLPALLVPPLWFAAKYLLLQ